MTIARPQHTARESPVAAQPRSAWREVELLVLITLVLVTYFSRLTYLNIRGEESRWARVAQEMLDTGDWIVPRQQGQPFPDRPPLNSWTMIAAAQVVGELNLVAIRLPAVLATLVATLATYLYARNFLSRLGALAAAAAYPTMGQVLQLGRLAESDALLTLCLSVALFAWHYYYACHRNPAFAWLIGYACAAQAALAKGPQGPVYFVAICVVYLCLRRDWRMLFSRWHAAGLVVFVAVLAVWQVPFLCELDAAAASAVWAEGGEISGRFDYSNPRRVLGHWLGYPFEVFACLLPWSFLLPVLASRWFRRHVGAAAPMVGFAITAWAVALPTCWLPAESRTRYLMALYPCAALLVGAVVERSWEAAQRDWWSRSWDRFVLISSGAIAAVGLGVGVGRASGVFARLPLHDAVSPAFASCFLFACLLLASIMAWSRRRRDLVHAQLGVVAMAGFMALVHVGIVMNVQAAGSNQPQDAIARVRAMIPPGERLVSFDKVHHLFAYYYHDPIDLLPFGAERVATEMPGELFCFAVDPQAKPFEIPFAWRRVAEISCERIQLAEPRTKVVVGRRLSYDAQLGRIEEPLPASGHARHATAAPSLLQSVPLR